MGLTTIKLLGINITTSPKQKVLEEVRKCLEKGKKRGIKSIKNAKKPFIIFTPNPEIINYAQKNSYFRQIVNSAQINIPDGQGVVWGAKKLFGESIDRISGTDFMLELVGLAAKKGARIGLIGGRGGVALETRECLQKKYPGLRIEVLGAPEIRIQNSSASWRIRIQNYETEVRKKISNKILNSKLILNSKFITLNLYGNQDRETENYFKTLAREIINKNIDILFVALGFPKQEYFINKLVSSWFIVHRSEQTAKLTMNPLVMMAVGGAFDYISGRVSRAPKWMRERGLEWFYRLLKESWRVKRHIKGSVFFLKILFS